MQNPDLEKKLHDLREKKKKMVYDFTRKSVDAINLSEQAALTHMSICDSDCTKDIKAITKKLKKLKEKSVQGNGTGVEAKPQPED